MYRSCPKLPPSWTCRTSTVVTGNGFSKYNTRVTPMPITGISFWMWRAERSYRILCLVQFFKVTPLSMLALALVILSNQTTFVID